MCVSMIYGQHCSYVSMKKWESFNAEKLHLIYFVKSTLFNDKWKKGVMNDYFFSTFRFIKLSSPNINNLICAGCIVLYAAVILHGLDTNTVDIKHIATICNVRFPLFVFRFVCALKRCKQ